MSKLVKTGIEIYGEIAQTLLAKTLCDGDITMEGDILLQKNMNQRHLVLPDGLDKLEEMIKEEIRIKRFDYPDFSSVFACFKKENGI